MNLYETALNGLGLGSKAEDIERMYKDFAGNELAQAILLDINMKLDDLRRATMQAASEAKGLAEAVARYQDNPDISNAEWLGHYAKKVEERQREAQLAYTAVGQAWRLWGMIDKKL